MQNCNARKAVVLLQQTGPAVWLEFDFENELAERKDGSRYSSELERAVPFLALNSLGIPSSTHKLRM